MLIHELTKDECREVLKHTNLGRLACIARGAGTIEWHRTDASGSDAEVQHRAEEIIDHTAEAANAGVDVR